MGTSNYILYTFNIALYTYNYTLYTFNYALYTYNYTLYTFNYTLYNCNYTLYTFFTYNFLLCIYYTFTIHLIYTFTPGHKIVILHRFSLFFFPSNFRIPIYILPPSSWSSGGRILNPIQ